ncbi:hypothetical protein Ddye_006483 [Dipteronia dyeriana]|uniref:Uncharacterized protein n=1 Tax=Dipteronia dyeriana TaxID=168575 RepID=A0AAE0CQK6_9ROSI|nr:hypothetical protein Ddye_006483 [Dipteronia dyeriana]
MAEKTKKVTIMLLKVDLQCYKCCNKVKRVLYKFPQIQDQVYDEKNNTVMIKVVCCSPENIRDSICYKGRGSIKSIEILKPPEKPKQVDKPKADPPPKPADPPPKPTKAVTFVDVPKTTAPAPALVYPPGPVPPALVYPPGPVPPALVYPPGPVPIGVYCTECAEWRGGGPVRYCDGYCGRPVFDSWGGGGYRPFYGCRYSEDYFNEDNSQGCAIM